MATGAPKAKEQDNLLPQSQEAPIHGDVLESILSHLPLIDLVPASYVSKSWNHTIHSSFRTHEPWLILHTQKSHSAPYTTTIHAYDPRSHLWIEIISQPSISHYTSSPLRSSHSNLLYMLSPSKLSFSFDPLNLTWHHGEPPRVWRTNPIVARVSDKVIVAGSACDFEDDPLAVEMYDVVEKSWVTCESMPAVLKHSVSLATDNVNLFVTEKYSGVTHVFNPEDKKWSGPFDLIPDQRVSCHLVGLSNDRFILIGLIGEVDKVERIKVWEVNREDFGCVEITEMPLEFVGKLMSWNFHVSVVNVCLAGNFVYVYNGSEAEEVIVCEFVESGGKCSWGCVRNVVMDRTNCKERAVFTCSEVGIEDLQRATTLENRRFVACPW